MSKDSSYLSVADQAKAEVNAELRKEAVGKLKVLYIQLQKAQTIVDNLGREIEDYVKASEDGNL